MNRIHLDPAVLVSIVVRNYNYAHFLRDALDSAVAQTHPRVEIIVIDDGSSDGSSVVLKEYETRCRILFQPNQGEIGALNSGFSAVRGDLVLFLDADDVLAPGAVAAVVAAWTPDVARISFPMRVMTETGRLLDVQRPHGEALDLTIEQQFAQFGEAVSACQSANAYAASVLRPILPIDEQAWSFPPDCYLNALTSVSGRMVSLPDPLGGYRLHSSNFTLRNTVDRRRRAGVAAMHVRLHEALRRFVGEALWPRFRPILPTFHWFHRLISLCAMPDLHPFPCDRRGALLRRCLGAVWAKQDAGLGRKLILISGAFTVALLPSWLLRRLLPGLLMVARGARYPGLYLFRWSRLRHWRRVYRLSC